VFTQFRGKRLSIGVPGSALRALMLEVLKTTGGSDASTQLLNAGHAAHPLATNDSALKAVIAPNPMLLSAAPTPGTQTEAMTFMRPVCKRGTGEMLRSGTTKSSVATGSSIVVSATAVKP
jgi:TRAP-type uncharacterized transport system substrate-binding protein